MRMLFVSRKNPIPGFYWTRIVRDGPKVPVCICIPCPMCPLGTPIERSRRPIAFMGDRECDVWEVWPFCAKNRIDEAEWRYLLDLGRWASVHAPELPEAQPRRSIDHNTMPLPF